MTAAVLTAADGDFPDIPGQPYVSPDDLASIGPMWQQAVQQQLVPVVAEVYQTSAGVVHAQMVDATQVPTLPSVGSLAAEQYLAQASNTFAEVGDDLWATARSELLDGFEKGESIDQLAARLRASAGLTAKKAVLVARTQVLDASNAGSIATARASGIEMNKGWLDTGPPRTRPTHLQAGVTYGSDAGMIPLAAQFSVGGYDCDRPHDPTLPPAERYNCRCSVIFGIPDDSVDDAIRDAEPVPPIPGTSGVVEPLPDPYAGDLVSPALPGPDLGIPTVPGAGLTVRPALQTARTTTSVSRVFSTEYRRITGRDIDPNSLYFEGSVATAREHAEGVLRGLERFPDVPLERVVAFGTGNEYASATSRAIRFNQQWTSPASRKKYLDALAQDAASGWHPAGSRSPIGIALHEFGHVLDAGKGIYPDLDVLLARAATARDVELAARRAAGELIDAADVAAGSGVDGLISREVSRYATKNREELVAEAFADVMTNGEAASQLSRDIFSLLEAEYRRTGGVVRAVTTEALPALPSPAAALAARTVPQLRALAKERGITIPPGSKKADIVRLLDEGPPSPTATPGGLLTPVQFDARATAALDGAQAEAAIPVHARITAPGSEPSTWRATGFNGAAADPEAVKAVTQYLRRPGAMNERLRFPDDPTHPLHEQTLDELLGYEPANPTLVAEAAARADAQIAAIDRVMAQSLMPSESVTWRGVSMRALGDVPTDLVGYEWTDLGFVSTSTTRSVAENSFAGSGALLRIVVPEGTQALGFTGLGEAEMLLGRGLRYRIVADRGLTSEGARLLDVEIVPAGAAPAGVVEVPLAKRTVAQLRALAADRKITVPKGAKKPDIVRLLEAPPLTEAEQRAATRALARETNTLIEQTSATARVLAEVDELLAKKASATTIREAIADALAEPGQLFAGADPAVLAALRAVASDPVKLRAAIARLGGKAKIKPVSKAGAKVTFDADTMEGVGGIDIEAGARVTVVRRGSTVTLPDGTVMQLEKARVTPVTAPVKAVKAVPVKATPVKRLPVQGPSVDDYSGDYTARQLQLRAEHGGEPTITRLEGGISSRVELRTYPDGYRVVRKDYSGGPTDKVRAPLPSDQIPADAEELAAKVLDAFDLPTPAVVRVNPHTVEMEFVDGVQGGESGVLKAPAAVTDSEQGRRLGLADAVMGLRDRNGGGWMRVGDGIVPIDNGDAFSGVGADTAAFGNPFVRYLMNRDSWKPDLDVDPVALAEIRDRLVALRPEFVRLGQVRWHDDMLARVDEIAKRAVGKPAVKAVKAVPSAVDAQVSVAEARKLLKFQEVVDAMIQHGALKEGVGDLILEQAARDIGVSAAARDHVIKALLTGSADETRAAMAAVFRDIGVKTAAKPGTVVSFDPKIHVAPGRVKVPPGTKVRISEPGLQIQDRGKTVILTKTRVEPMGTSPTRAVTPEVQRVADLSQTGEVVRRPLGGGMTGEVHEVTYQNGQVLIRKELGRRAEDVRAVAEQIDAEELAPLVYQALGVRVPATYRATDRVIYMTRVEGRTGEEVLGWGKVPGPDMLDSDQGRMMGLGDWLVQDTDRNMGGFIIDPDGNMWSLDHGFAFQRNVEDMVGGQFEFAGHFDGLTNDMSPADMAEIRARLEGLRGQFEAVGRLAWWRAMMKRVDAVAKGATGTGTRL